MIYFPTICVALAAFSAVIFLTAWRSHRSATADHSMHLSEPVPVVPGENLRG